jgi:hypothetical protein
VQRRPSWGPPLFCFPRSELILTIATVQYPPAAERRLAFAESALRVYEGDVTLVVRFASAPPAECGSHSRTKSATTAVACRP